MFSFVIYIYESVKKEEIIFVYDIYILNYCQDVNDDTELWWYKNVIKLTLLLWHMQLASPTQPHGYTIVIRRSSQTSRKGMTGIVYQPVHKRC